MIWAGFVHATSQIEMASSDRGPAISVLVICTGATSDLDEE
jgi:hypothetical protein